ncbi:prolyl aminopeptidase [Nisaea acidiphila]|uniref:Proline iminopeptidase n=1 Tax=Nisaea acidiphila TaxID=1862145 RepID=A0A9J7AUZ6_9PROT|nr:prolyl aminopeptidase [Nisaea acidiphila]UUX51152.1 prolyl aminopeptidase [Nisaea acidiphila]
MSERVLFPRTAARRSGHLQVDDLHRIYWEQIGKSGGIPVVFLHGGPGSGISEAHRRFFDPETFDVVLFDQRGTGRSAPLAELRGNTTQDLITDIERLREHFGIEQWIVFGGSWGSTLALAYGEAHPERCLGFVLRGIFLGTEREVDWFLHGMGQFFPEAERRFVGFLPEQERGDLLAHYLRRLVAEDPEIHQPAADCWAGYEAACSSLLPLPAIGGEEPQRALSLARLEAHYFANRMFLEPGQLLAQLDRIRHLPAVIVQGRYDVICPISTAAQLAAAWPEAKFEIVPDAGHSAMEPGIARSLIEAMESIRQTIRP